MMKNVVHSINRGLNTSGQILDISTENAQKHEYKCKKFCVE